MIRAWRIRDFRAVFHLACRHGLKPEGIAECTGLPVDQVLNVMRGNETLDSAELAAIVARGLGMTGEAAKTAGVPMASAIPPKVAPAALAPRPQRTKHADHPGIRISELRNELGWSREYLAERAEVSVPTISKIERQERNPSLAMMRKIADPLGVAVADIVDPLSLEKPSRQRERPPDYLPADLIGQPDFAAACGRRDLGKIFSLAKEAGFTISHLARRCEMTIGQVTAYMRHGRKASEVFIFDRVSDGLHIPGSMLGIAPRPWETSLPDNNPAVDPIIPTKPEEGFRSGPPSIFEPHRIPSPDEMAEEMKRRDFLVAAATTASFSAVGAMTARETIRHETRTSLTTRPGTTDVEEWREIAAEYGESYLTTSPNELLKALMVDLCGLQAVMQAGPGETDQRALSAVGAMLSAITAQTVGNLGNLRESRRWWRTARNAADESQDPYTMLLVRGKEIVRAGYEHRPLTSILQLIDELEARITSKSPASAMPGSLSGKAQTLAMIGPSAANEAEHTLNRLRAASEALPASFGQVRSIYSWGEENLRYTESLTYTYLGKYREAGQAQTQALSLYPADDLRSPAQIELQRALCLVGSGDVQSGVSHAQGIITSVPAMHRIRPVADLGRRVLRAIPAQQQDNPAVREYDECLSVSFEVAPELTA
jgi:transcriptional regulator with XRE-family HTH domain